MGRGTSLLRGMVRGSENMDVNCASTGVVTPSRKQLGVISEASRNSGVTPKGKVDGLMLKGKKRGLFPHSEYVGGGTPDRQAELKKLRGRLPSPVKGQAAVAVRDSEGGEEVPSEQMILGAAGASAKGHAQQQKHCGESANFHTPRAHMTKKRGKHGAESEPAPSAQQNSNQIVSATPAKRVTRAQKYGAAHGPAPAGPSASRAMIPLPTGARNVSQGAAEQHFNLEEDPTFWLDHNVQVLIRTRPINSTEMVSQGFSKCLRQESPHTLTWVGPPETRFTFDHVAGEIVSQEKLFNVAGLPMVENCMGGYNSCMFAYGQTGSGKTHTMLGDIEHLGDRPSDNRGMTARVFEYLFSRIEQEEEQRKDENLKFLTKCSFLEIYNEQITDLLEPISTNLQMREDVRKGVYVEKLTEVEVNSVQDVIQLLSQGSANRKVAATNMNRESSRSHSVFTCIIESRWERDSMTNIRFGRLNLVDLAGSERQKTSGVEGERLKEAANINKSLSTLGLVIMILVDVAKGKQRHVPYRDSKLTFLLQDSLGGNSKTMIIATVSPSSCNVLETLSTLKFAQRAKLIRNSAVINEDALGDVDALRAQIQQMKEELERLRWQSVSRIPLSQDDVNPGRGSFDSWGDAHKFFGSPQVLSRKADNYRSAVEELRSNLSASLDIYSKMERQVNELQDQVEKLKTELSAKEGSVGSGIMAALELENSKHLEVIAELKLQLEQSEEKSKTQESAREQLDQQLKDSLLEATKEAIFEALRGQTKELQSKEPTLVGAQYAAPVKQIEVETEEMAVQQCQLLPIDEYEDIFEPKSSHYTREQRKAIWMLAQEHVLSTGKHSWQKIKFHSEETECLKNISKDTMQAIYSSMKRTLEHKRVCCACSRARHKISRSD